MKGHFAAFSLVVPDYEEALAFYVGVLGFRLVEDVDMGDKRWVTVAPCGSAGKRDPTEGEEVVEP